VVAFKIVVRNVVHIIILLHMAVGAILFILNKFHVVI
jgi:hypothetical protein